MDARRSARNSPCSKEAQEGVKGGTLAGGSPFAGGLSRPQPVRPRGAGGGRRKGSSRTPTPTAGGKRAVCHVIYCEVIPRPGGGRRNGVTPAVTAAAGRRGRRPLRGGCGNVRSAIIPRPGGGGTPPLQGAGGTWWGRRGPLRRDVEDAVPCWALPVSRLYERKMPPEGGIFLFVFWFT